jgi:hypothetical protein
MSSHKSPEKRRHDALSGISPSPLALKRCRKSVHQYPALQDSSDLPQPQVVYNVQSPPQLDFKNLIPLSRSDSVAPGDVSTAFPIMPLSDTKINTAALGSAPVATGVQMPVAGTSEASYIINQETHDARLVLQAEVRSEKGTDPAYARHLRNYELFTMEDQARRLEKDPKWPVMCPHPITTGKAALFLGYETTRAKVSFYCSGMHHTIPDVGHFFPSSTISAHLRVKTFLERASDMNRSNSASARWSITDTIINT